MDATTPPRKHGRQLYAHPLAYFVPIYDTQERQLKNWVARGRSANPPDLPPLEQPAAMPTWYARHFPARSVPARITQAASTAAAQRALTPAPISPGATGDTENAPPQTSQPKTKNTGTPETPASDSAPREGIADFTQVEAIGMEGAIDRLQRTLTILLRDYESALGDPSMDDATITLRASRVDRCMERLRKCETSLDEQRKARGELVPVAEIREELHAIHGAMANSLVATLVDQLGTPRDVSTALVDRWFAQLRASCFFADMGNPCTPAPSPAPLPSAPNI